MAAVCRRSTSLSSPFRPSDPRAKRRNASPTTRGQTDANSSGCWGARAPTAKRRKNAVARLGPRGNKAYSTTVFGA